MLTKEKICDAMAKSMREFGYPDVTTEMAEEIYDSYVSGSRGAKLPHGVIGMFLEDQLKELSDAGVKLNTYT